MLAVPNIAAEDASARPFQITGMLARQTGVSLGAPEDATLRLLR